MQKYILLLLMLASIISGCAPQVTVTSEVTFTLPPPTALPTPTLHPDFITLQEQIAAAGERFTLNPDGTVQDGAATIPGLQVAVDGKITLTVNGEQVEVDPSTMNFDDENGLSFDGYEDLNSDHVWEVVEPPAEITEAGKTVLAIMTELKIPESELDLKLVNGKLVCTEVATGDNVCDENGRLTLDYMHEVLSRADVIGGPTDPANPNGSRGHQPERYSPVRKNLIEAGAQFRREYLNLFGVPYHDEMKNGRIEFIEFPGNHWALAHGRIVDGTLVFDHLIFRPKGNENAIKWYPFSLKGSVDSIWSDEVNP